MLSPRAMHRVALILILMLLVALPAWADEPKGVGPSAGESTMSVCVRNASDDSLVAGAHVRYVDSGWTMIDEVTVAQACPSHMTTGITAGTASVLSLPAGLAVRRNAGVYDVYVGYDPEYGFIYEPGNVSNHVDNPEILASLDISAVVQPGYADFWVAPFLTDIQGTVWQDMDGSGSREAGEGLSAYDVQAFLNGELYRRTTSAADGSYHLAVFEPGSYWVKARLAGQPLWEVERQVVIDVSAAGVTPIDLEVIRPPTATPTSAPTPTPTPTLTPEPGAIVCHGTAQDGSGVPVSGMIAHISRESGGWVAVRDATTGSDGVFRAWLSPIPGRYRVVGEPPAGWTIASAALPPGVAGEVIGADTLEFDMAEGVAEVGPFAFTLSAMAPTPTDPPPTLPPPPEPQQLGMLGSVTAPSLTWGVAVSDTLCLLGATESGLRLIDAANPAQPVEIGALDTDGYLRNVAVSGDRAFLADGTGGLVIADISDPTAPQRLGHCPTYAAIAVAVSGTEAYVADYSGGLRVIDVSDPVSPTVLGQLDTTYAMGLDVVGSTVYLADDAGGLRIVDVTDPTEPIELGHLDTTSAKGVTVLGQLAYVADSWGGLRIVDVADPEAPFEVGHCETGGYAWTVAVRGFHAFLADGDGGVAVIDASDPANPVVVGAYASDGACYGLALEGGLVYASQGAEGMVILGPNNHRIRLPMVIRQKS